MNFDKVPYAELNSRQKENYNFQKISGILADYGFVTLRLSDDWGGADFIAKHINGDDYIKVQLKGRISIDKKYMGKDVWIAFPNNTCWYLVPHDAMVNYLLGNSTIKDSKSWETYGGYSIGGLIGKRHVEFFGKYKIG